MSRGQVAIRLSLRDQEAFRRQMEAIGPDAEKTFDRMMRAARPVDQRLKIIDQAANDLKSSVQDLGRQAGPAGAFLTTLGGPLALAAAAALGAVALAVREVLVLMERSREAAAYASGLEDTARAAGVAMSAVQDMATTVQLAGGSFEAGTQALEQWAIRLGRVRALGQGETFDALQVMGLGADSFAGMNAAEALDLVIERLLEIDDISTRLALADRLGLASMSELLRRNADDVRNLRVEAESINTALSEATLRRLAEAADEMDRLRTRQERAEAVQGAAAVELELRRQRALTALEERKAALFARRLPLEERTAEMLDAQRISLEAQIENLRLMGPEMRGMADAAAAELDQIIQRRADLADEMERAAAAAEREARAMATVPETGFRGPFSDPDEAYRPPPGPPELDLTRRRQLEALVESSLRSLMTPLQQVAELEAELNLARENGIEITEAQIARIVQLRR
ncbi:MAG: hypothetical protein ACQRW7_11325, partial [Caulobacterales bacterium]|uniref:hypothetical protein n=1 Tax=Glycocaulis sp. TaxID=1969725 RepID=UPI003F9F8EE7